MSRPRALLALLLAALRAACGDDPEAEGGPEPAGLWRATDADGAVLAGRAALHLTLQDDGLFALVMGGTEEAVVVTGQWEPEPGGAVRLATEAVGGEPLPEEMRPPAQRLEREGDALLLSREDGPLRLERVRAPEDDGS